MYIAFTDHPTKKSLFFFFFSRFAAENPMREKKNFFFAEKIKITFFAKRNYARFRGEIQQNRDW